MKIGIVGSKTYPSATTLKTFIFKCSQKFRDDITFFSLGDRTEIGKLVKKYALEFDAQYGEFNPAFTKRNLYSMMPEKENTMDYYDKAFHPSHYWHSIQMITMNSDRIFVFVDYTDRKNEQWKLLIKAGKKYNKKIVFFI